MAGLFIPTVSANVVQWKNNVPRRIAYYLRSCGNLHYFAAIKPYLDHFMQQGLYQNFLVVRQLSPDPGSIQEYTGYTHLFTTDCNLDTYDLVLTPTFLRPGERTKRTRAVQIFHGMSDKPVTYERDFSDYLLCLCAGLRQVHRLLQYEHNQAIKWRIIGYPKFDTLPVHPRLFDNPKKTVIYCPTWRKGNLSSIELFLDNPDLIEQICQDYNLIVKPHPNILNPDREFYEQGIDDRLRQTPGIQLIHSGNVMGWFAQADLYLGDISASGYEWLYFDRPMVFLNPQPGRLRPSADVASLTYLWNCGPVCDDIRQLKTLIDQNIGADAHHNQREAVLHYSVLNPRGRQAAQRGIDHIEQLLRSNCPG
jgi:hypothetical protein